MVYRGPPENRQATWDARRRRAREALLLLAALARIDYASWIGAMVRIASFSVPKYLALQHCPKIPLQICIYVSARSSPQYFQWENLELFMGDLPLSEAGAEDMVDIREIARREGHGANLFDAIPIKLAVEPGERTLEDGLAILRGITKTVREMLIIKERNTRIAVTGTARTRPWFRLDSVDLYFRGFTLHPDVFDAIRELLETGIKVDSLTLPSLLPTITHHPNQAQTSLAWAELVVVALGHRALVSGNRVQLDRLYVDGYCMTEQFMIPLCSALRETRVVKHVWLRFDKFNDESLVAQRRIGAWLYNALFSSVPSNTVTTLELNSLTFQSTSLGTLVSGHTEPSDPVGNLWNAVKNHRARSIPSFEARPTVCIASEATITARGVQGRALNLTTTSPFTGTLVRDEATRSFVDVLVPGLGFCQVPRAKIVPFNESVRQCTEPEDIQTLVVQIDPDTRHHGLDQHRVATLRRMTEGLLRFTGPSLMSLALGGDFLNRTDVEMVSRLCPKLTSLRLQGLTVDSMDALTNLYESPTNCQISSLDLSRLHVSIEAFERFLCTLTPADRPHPIQEKLQRLRVGEGYSTTFREETRHAITHLLCHNLTLSHFLLFDMHDDDDSSDEDNGRDENVCESFNGQLLPQFPFRRDRKLAFLSVVQHRDHQNGSTSQLGSDLVQQIFVFAADRVWCRAFTLYDLDSELTLN